MATAAMSTSTDAPLADARRPFAFMPQRDALMPWRRIIDNATLGLEVQGMSRKAARDEVASLFARVRPCWLRA